VIKSKTLLFLENKVLTVEWYSSNKYLYLTTMIQNLKILLLVIWLPLQPAVAQDSSHFKNHFKKIKVKDSASQTIIQHTYYTIGYFEKYRIPLWTFYCENKETIKRCLLPRKGSFKADPLTSKDQATDADYAMPFEKGHLVPCEAMTFDAEAMKETFYYTNCVPQYEKVNSGRWKTLEKLVNNWILDNDELMVFTGNVVSEQSARRGPHGVVVPDYCFKIVLDYKEPEIKAIAFIVPNKDEKMSTLENYVSTIDQIETLTGFDFFADLPLTIQDKFESASEITQWDWKVGKYNQFFKTRKAEQK
jgi:endonuclease G